MSSPNEKRGRMRYFLWPTCLALLGLATPVLAQRLVWLPTEEMTVYICKSRLNGTWPLIGPLHHCSVAFCPKGQLPAIYQDGTWVSNPCCIFCGTHPDSYGFLVEENRRGMTWRRVNVPAHVVLQRIIADQRRWWLLLYNCQNAGKHATRPIDEEDQIPFTGP
jgi:hypothetical protein